MNLTIISAIYVFLDTIDAKMEIKYFFKGKMIHYLPLNYLHSRFKYTRLHTCVETVIQRIRIEKQGTSPCFIADNFISLFFNSSPWKY